MVTSTITPASQHHVVFNGHVLYCNRLVFTLLASL